MANQQHKVLVPNVGLRCSGLVKAKSADNAILKKQVFVGRYLLFLLLC
jgi:hypothetical protein